MNWLENIRFYMYWLNDIIHGGKVREYYKNIKKYNWPNSDNKELREYQEKEISKLLSITCQNVPFYANMKSNRLKDWPVVNKNIIKENKDLFKSKVYSFDELYIMSTSGSTGTPFISLQNIEKKKHVNAETIYYLGLQGYKVGQRIIFLRSIVDECKKTKLTQFFQNIYQINCNDLSDEGISIKLKEIARLSNHYGAVLLGYASTFEAFRKYFENHGFEEARKCRINSITSGSEMLFDKTREVIEKAFNCKCYSRYANEENGFLGQDGFQNNVFFIDDADYYIEILKFNSDDNASLGEKGRIVVTDLYNYAQPMIRYDTGDIGAIIEVNYKGKKYRAINDFCGRIVDSIYSTDGNLISPHSITNTMWKYNQIKQFQFIQEKDKDYCIKINLGECILDEKSLIHDLLEIVGDDANIKVEYIEEIPVLASGKRKYIVSLLHK